MLALHWQVIMKNKQDRGRRQSLMHECFWIRKFRRIRSNAMFIKQEQFMDGANITCNFITVHQESSLRERRDWPRILGEEVKADDPDSVRFAELFWKMCLARKWRSLLRVCKESERNQNLQWVWSNSTGLDRECLTVREEDREEIFVFDWRWRQRYWFLCTIF